MPTTLTRDGLAMLLASVGVGSVSSPAPPAAHALSRPIDIYRIHLADIVSKLAGCDHALAYDSLQTPSTVVNGDLVLPVPRLRLKDKKPNDQCIEFGDKFPDHPLVQRAKASGIHLSFYFSPQPLSRVLLPYIFERRGLYGKDLEVGLRRISAGRSTIIGAYISNLYEIMGWDVVRVNYLGDWGKQFGLLAVGWERFGSEEEPPEQDASKQARDQGRDTAEIESTGLFAERNAYFKRMEDGDPEAIALWRRFRDTSIDRYTSTYARLNIGFDEYSGESQVQTATVESVENMLKEKGIYEEHDGSWIIDFRKHGAKALEVAVVRGRTGTTTYLLRDVAAILERDEKYAFDKMVYVVSSEQDLYFKRVFKTLELMGRADLAARLQHVNFGKVMGMSSRLGNAKLLGDILDQSRDAMHEVMKRNTVKYAQVPDPDAAAESIGISAVIVQDMSGKRINNYAFDITRMTSFEGDTRPYLQYCHARLNSVMRKADVSRDDLAAHLSSNPGALDADAAGKQHCADLLRLMAQYPDVTATAMRNMEPSTILTYLFRLTHQLSSAYDVLQVVGAHEGRDVMLARATLFEGARQASENGMKLLGLSPVERM